MENIWVQMLIGAVITTIVTSLASIFAEMYKEKRDKKNTKNSLGVILLEEFRIFDKYLENLRNSYSVRKLFDLKIIDVLLADINELNRARSSISGLGNTELQEKCIDILTSIKTFLIDARLMEGYYLDESKRLRDLSNKGDKGVTQHIRNLEDMIHDQRVEKLTELSDVRRTLKDIRRDLKLVK
jgi:hypothetical protein